MSTLPFVVFVAFGLTSVGQNQNASSSTAQQSAQPEEAATYSSLMQETDDLRQELDRDALALSKVPADPILKTDPFEAILEPFERLTLHINESAKLKIGATYTFVNQYALSGPDGVRRDQTSGRADVTALASARAHEHVAMTKTRRRAESPADR